MTCRAGRVAGPPGPGTWARQVLVWIPVPPADAVRDRCGVGSAGREAPRPLVQINHPFPAGSHVILQRLCDPESQ